MGLQCKLFSQTCHYTPVAQTHADSFFVYFVCYNYFFVLHCCSPSAAANCTLQVASDARAEIGPAAEPLFHASTFLKLERDAAGAISLPLFMSYVSRYAASIQLVRAGLW